MSTEVNSRRARQRQHLREFLTFGIIGGSGVLVNLGVVILLKRVTGMDDAAVRGVLFPLLLGKSFRVFHLFAMIAFVVANIWNFELNRHFTFGGQGKEKASRSRLVRFFLVGLGAQLIGLVIMSALMHPDSWIGLPRDVFDGSNGLRTPLYWAQLIQVLATTPISFVLQKLWTFAAPGAADDAAAPSPVDDRHVA